MTVAELQAKLSKMVEENPQLAEQEVVAHDIVIGKDFQIADVFVDVQVVLNLDDGQ